MINNQSPHLIQANFTNKNSNEKYPFTLPLFKNSLKLKFNNNVTFIAGENGTGKSTILETIAYTCGFNLEGGGRNNIYHNDEHNYNSELFNNLKLSWSIKTNQGFFMRAESFYNFASYIDKLAKEERKNEVLRPYGGKSLHEQSHGEAFLSLFNNRFRKGLFILDEPEAALSPNRQLSLLSIIYDLTHNYNAQFIIATHSPILLSYPYGELFYIIDDKIEKMNYKDTEHYNFTKSFLDNPEQYFRYLFE